MNKLLYTTAICLSLTFGYATLAQAAPSVEQNTVQHVVKKKKKVVKKKYVKAAKVAPQHNPFLKNDSIFSNSIEQSSAQYWAEERAREERARLASEESIKKIIPKKDREVIRKEIAMKCSWFTCEPVFKEVVVEAKKWTGKHQKDNRKELQGLFADGKLPPVDPVRIPWCAAFANAILSRSGYETTNSLMARSFLTWGVKTKNPKEGDIVVLARGNDGWSGHVGFFEGFEVVDGVKYVKVLGGNTEKSVQTGWYPVSKVLGYRTYA